MGGLESLAIQAEMLLSSRFNEIYIKFASKVFSLATSTHSDPSLRMKDSEAVQALYGELLDAARASRGTDALEHQALEAITKGIEKQQKCVNRVSRNRLSMRGQTEDRNPVILPSGDSAPVDTSCCCATRTHFPVTR